MMRPSVSLVGLATLALAALLGSADVRAEGDADAGKAKNATCAACHGQNGAGIAGNYPNIGGQNYRYLLAQLRAFKSGERAQGLMAGQVDNLSDQDLMDLAAYYAAQPLATGTAADEAVELGESIYRGGILDKGVAACAGCHSPRGIGNAPAGFPAIAGQNVDYTVQQLTAYREGIRQTDAEYGQMMRNNAARLTDGEIRAVANYLHGLRP